MAPVAQSRLATGSETSQGETSQLVVAWRGGGEDVASRRQPVSYT
ncbi:hypothetical protein A2U01_0106100, partial [Trifolium medium]|nr:hypothetical protein [Trifolium medium]